MRRYLNEKLVRRNSLFGRGLVLSGLGVLLAGFLVSFTRPEAINAVLIAALLGTLASQVGLQFVNRWGRSPREDEIIAEALKGLDDRYILFHYFLGARHVLLGPMGAVAILPNAEPGDIERTDGGWSAYRNSRGLLRRPGRRRLGNIERDAMDAAEELRAFLSRRTSAEAEVEIVPVVVFVHPQAKLKPAEAAVETVHLKKLKEWLRRQPKRKSLDEEDVQAVAAELTQ